MFIYEDIIVYTTIYILTFLYHWLKAVGPLIRKFHSYFSYRNEYV